MSVFAQLIQDSAQAASAVRDRDSIHIGSRVDGVVHSLQAMEARMDTLAGMMTQMLAKMDTKDTSTVAKDRSRSKDRNRANAEDRKESKIRKDHKTPQPLPKAPRVEGGSIVAAAVSNILDPNRYRVLATPTATPTATITATPTATATPVTVPPQ